MSAEPPLKIVVTGFSGLVGSRIAAAAPPHLELIPVADPPEVDITRPGDLAALLDRQDSIDAVLHLAAFTDTAAAHEQDGDEEGLCYRVNVLGTREVATACAARGTHLIQVSTDYVFPGDREEPWTEADEPRPIDWYGRTKALAEDEAKQADAWTIVRLAFPYGPNPFGRDLLGKLLAALDRNDAPIRLFDDQFITPTYLGDITAGLLKICELRPRNEIFHLTGSEWITPYAFGRAVAEVFERDANCIEASKLDEVVAATGRPRQRFLKMDNSKWSRLAERSGLRPPVRVVEGLKLSRKNREARGPNPKTRESAKIQGKE